MELEFTLITLCLFSFLSSFCSLTVELIIAKTLVTLSDQSVLWESLTIGFYMLGIGCGVMGFPYLKKKSVSDFLFQVELLLSFCALFAIPFLLSLHIVYHIYFANFALTIAQSITPLHVIMLTAQALTILTGFLAGGELASLLFFAKKQSYKIKQTSSQLYAFVLACYYFGALTGSLIFTTVSVHYSLSHTALFVASINAGLALYLLKELLKKLLKNSHSAYFSKTLAFIFFIFVLTAYLTPLISQLQLKNFYYNKMKFVLQNNKVIQLGPKKLSELPRFYQDSPTITRIYSPYQHLDLVPPFSYLGQEQSFTLFLNGHFQFSLNTERAYHEFLAHIPIMMMTIPKRILLLGGGDGLLLRELLKYPEPLQHIDLVEIDPEMLAFAQSSMMLKVNKDSLHHPKVSLHRTDAYTWLRRTAKEPYDAIYMDFPYPYDVEIARLYSVEFFTLLATHLKDSGFLVMDVPIFPEKLDHQANCVLFNTLEAGGFKRLLSFREHEETFLFASKQDTELRPSYRQLPISLQELKQDWFSQADQWFSVQGCSQIADSKIINSMFKPYAIPYQDPLFY